MFLQEDNKRVSQKGLSSDKSSILSQVGPKRRKKVKMSPNSRFVDIAAIRSAQEQSDDAENNTFLEGR